ncbi:MAG: carboxypeptidase-like regulatory domain-containing protein [Patescibacteria group bacterium]|nr:carboxypeptidase-like regulatory domain-containing protein [Patescibacteria group bacterium]
MMQRPHDHSAHIVLLLACMPAIALLTGCGGPSGPPRQPVLGTLTFNGTPVPDAQVAFQCPEKNVYFTAITDPAGRFEILAASGNGLPAGDYKVTVYPAPSDDEEATQVPQRPDIPQRYRATATTDLTHTVAEGDNDFEIKMTGP